MPTRIFHIFSLTTNNQTINHDINPIKILVRNALIDYFYHSNYQRGFEVLNVDSYKDQSSMLVIVSWLVWIIAVMILNVMFMNFIIAVISESYEKVMQKLVAESYRVKVQMIVERELQFTDEELKSPKLFPKYLLLRRPVLSESNEQGEWQGFVKDIKQSVRSVAAKQKTENITNMRTQENLIKSLDSSIQNLQKQIKSFESNAKLNGERTKIQDLCIQSPDSNIQAHSDNFDQLNNRISQQDNEIQLIKGTLVQFIEEYRLENQKTQLLLQSLQKPQE